MTSRRYPDTSHVRLRNPHVQVIEIDANHFDPYFDPLFPEVLAHQLTFLRR